MAVFPKHITGLKNSPWCQSKITRPEVIVRFNNVFNRNLGQATVTPKISPFVDLAKNY